MVPEREVVSGVRLVMAVVVSLVPYGVSDEGNEEGNGSSHCETRPQGSHVKIVVDS